MTQALNLDGIIAKVRGLLNTADHPNTSSEMAKNYRDKAEELMAKYRIEEEGLIAKDQFSITPLVKTIPIIRYKHEFEDSHWSLFAIVCLHGGVLCHGKYEPYEANDGEYWLMGYAVGYESDLRFVELLWESVRLAFIGHLDPEVDPLLLEAENIYRLRSSGIPRKDVAERIWGKWTHANSARVGKVYKEECLRRGEKPALDGRGVNAKTYREVYAREFTRRVDERLRLARDGALAQGGGIELSGRKERVQEALWTAFPYLRPKPREEGTPVPEEAGKSRKRLALHETKAFKKKLERMYASPAALAGQRAGIAAGDKVNISRTAARTDRIEDAETEEFGIDDLVRHDEGWTAVIVEIVPDPENPGCGLLRVSSEDHDGVYPPQEFTKVNDEQKELEV